MWRTFSRPNPASSAALSTLLWLCADVYTISGADSPCSPPRAGDRNQGPLRDAGAIIGDAVDDLVADTAELIGCHDPPFKHRPRFWYDYVFAMTTLQPDLAPLSQAVTRDVRVEVLSQHSQE